MRTAKPWYRSANDTWYVWHRGQQIPLAKGKRARRDAEAAFHRLMAAIPSAEPQTQNSQASEASAGQSLLVAELLDQFLDWVQFNLDCFDRYRNVLQTFALGCGQLTVAELKPIHVTTWLAKKPTWGPTTRNRIIGIIKRAFNWAVDQGLLEHSPLRRLSKPPSQRRERILSSDERDKMLAAASDDAFRDLLIALQDTGARPGEIRQVTAAQVNLDHGVWVLTKHKTVKKTKRPRVIYLTPRMVELTRRLMARHPDGPLFRNRFGEPWSNNAVRIRFRRLRARLPELQDVVAYCYRHSFATDGLVRGVPIATVAELLGHASTAMVEQCYGHLAQERGYLREAAQAVRGEMDQNSTSDSPR
jgi:integrase